MWFRKSKHLNAEQPTTPSRVEIEVAKDANKEVKETAKRINEDVKGLLVQNGFSLTIALAASRPSTHNTGRH